MSSRYTEAERRQWVLAYSKSGLSQSSFARNHGISIKTFSNWVKKYKAEKQEKESAFALVKMEPKLFTHSSDGSPMRCRAIVGDIVIEFEDLPDPAWITALLSGYMG